MERTLLTKTRIHLGAGHYSWAATGRRFLCATATTSYII